MALVTSDLFYVQRPTGGDAGNYKMQAGDLVDFIAGSSGALNYRGTVDCTLPVGNQLEENPPLQGDIYINTGNGTVDNSGTDSTDAWVGIQGDAIADGQRVVFDGTSWEIVGQSAGGGLESVQGVAPIQVDDADNANPIISIDEATQAAYGSTRLAQDPPNAGDLTSTDVTDVLHVAHFNELAGRITVGAAGGVQSVSADNGLTAAGTTDVIISGVDATTAVIGVVQLTDTVTTDSSLAVTGTAVEGYAVPLNINSLSALP
jgi:hypothetical protein